MSKRSLRLAGVVFLGFTPSISLAQLAPETESYAVRLPRAAIVDSDTPAKVVGQAFILSHKDVTVAIRWGACVLPLRLDGGGNLGSAENTFYVSNDCTGTPYVDTGAAKLSVMGNGCELFVINDNNEVFYVDPDTPASTPPGPYMSRRTVTDDGCFAVNLGSFDLVKANDLPVGDLDTLFVAPFELAQ